MNNAEKKLILLIEDDDIVSDILVKRLEKAGYLVETANDGKRGLTMIQEKKPDLVLLDIMLPVLDGFGVLEELRDSGILPDLPVIIISNSGQPVEIERALKLGVKDHLVKLNFNPGEVLEKVKRIL
ncbi:MAG: response regulator [Patescibacteria group bacterium]